MSEVMLSMNLGDNPAGFVSCNVCLEVVSIGHPMTWDEITAKVDDFTHKHDHV